MAVVLAVFGVVSAVAVPKFMVARDLTHKKTCIANLSTLQLAKSQWAMEHHAAAGVKVTMKDLTQSGYLRGEDRVPVCPSGGVYELNAIGVKPACSMSH